MGWSLFFFVLQKRGHQDTPFTFYSLGRQSQNWRFLIFQPRNERAHSDLQRASLQSIGNWHRSGDRFSGHKNPQCHTSCTGYLEICLSSSSLRKESIGSCHKRIWHWFHILILSFSLWPHLSSPGTGHPQSFIFQDTHLFYWV